jgi:hypothetical protein
VRICAPDADIGCCCMPLMPPKSICGSSPGAADEKFGKPGGGDCCIMPGPCCCGGARPAMGKLPCEAMRRNSDITSTSVCGGGAGGSPGGGVRVRSAGLPRCGVIWRAPSASPAGW